MRQVRDKDLRSGRRLATQKRTTFLTDVLRLFVFSLSGFGVDSCHPLSGPAAP
jgi:hypothetical protein